MNIKESVKTTKAQDAEILRIVKEWMRGCTCANQLPSDCIECTMGMSFAIEQLVFKIPTREEIRSKLAMMKRGDRLRFGNHWVNFSEDGLFRVDYYKGGVSFDYSLKSIVDKICKTIGAK